VKDTLSSRHWILFLAVLLMLGLVACERPLHEEIDGETEGAYPSLEAEDGAPVENKREPFLPMVTDLSGAGAYPAPEGAAGGSVDGTLGEASSAPEMPEPLIYEVQSGDTLVTIALQYDVSIEDIAAASGLANVDVLDIGQRLVIPIEGLVAADAAASDTAQETASETGEAPVAESSEGSLAADASDSVLESAETHIVQTGDNLYRIGLLYGCTHQEIALFNKMANPDVLEVGQEILIPICD
jgi:LysM repeat protein